MTASNTCTDCGSGLLTSENRGDYCPQCLEEELSAEKESVLGNRSYSIVFEFHRAGDSLALKIFEIYRGIAGDEVWNIKEIFVAVLNEGIDAWNKAKDDIWNEVEDLIRENSDEENSAETETKNDPSSYIKRYTEFMQTCSKNIYSVNNFAMYEDFRTNGCQDIYVTAVDRFGDAVEAEVWLICGNSADPCDPPPIALMGSENGRDLVRSILAEMT